MRLIVGLGNPGEKYKNNRHNIGHRAVDFLKTKKSLKNTLLLKTNTFMNNSGDFVANYKEKYQIELDKLFIIHDDLDIKLGDSKIQLGKGPKVHNGLKSIYEKLGTNEFWHVRIGVDNRDPENREKGEDYVLKDFTSEELQIIERVLKKLADFLVV